MEGEGCGGVLCKAKEGGEEEFEVDGKKYQVEESRKFSKKQLMENSNFLQVQVLELISIIKN